MLKGEQVWFNVAEAAEYLGVTQRWMRRNINDRKIRFNKLGGLIRFHIDDLDELIDSGFIEVQQPLRPRGSQALTEKQQRERRRESAA